MERDRPPVVPVTVSLPGRAGAGDAASPDDLLGSDHPRRPAPSRRTRVLVLGAAAALAAGVLVVRDVREPPQPPPAPEAAQRPAGTATVDDGLTATASLGAARTDERYVQRLTLTVVLEPYDGRGERGTRLLGDEVALLDVRVRGFAVVPDDRRTPIPLGRFGRANVGRATTLSLEAFVTDCSVEPQARREVHLDVRTGEGPVEVLRAAVQPELVRALDRVVSRACRRPRG